ncbi:MAG: hypothetical protein JWP94_3571 [Mucilaginibacter sp.]|jgi:hypothetical protein|nr:hypothetical protein [Mucilaginibacter sp.]
MKRFSLIIALLSAVLLLQNCKKDTVTATATSNTTLFAVVNDTTWIADTVRAAITYNSATKTKVFTCTGIGTNKEINVALTQNNAINTSGFPLATFIVDNTPDLLMSYYTMQKNSSGAYVLAPQGTVGPGSGGIIISAIDSVKRQITGTFSFTSLKNTYDSQGNIATVTLDHVTAGAFNNLPYTFKSN